MHFDTPRPRQRTRRRLLRDLVALIVFTAGTILAIWLIQSDRIREQLSRDQIQQVADHARTELNDFFTPIEKMLLIFRQWGQAGILNPASVASLNAKFFPILADADHLSSIMVADTTGTGYFLIKDKETWLTRSTGLKGSSGRVLWQRWSDSGKLLDKWQEKSDYDPRRRPWFQGALNSVPAEKVFWTTPYSFFTLSTYGVTASVKWHPRGKTARTYVVALDVPLAKLVKTVTGFTAGVNGNTFLADSDGRVLAPDLVVLGNTPGKNLPDTLAGLFIPAEKYGRPMVTGALVAWRTAGKPEKQPLEFKSLSMTCWAIFQPAPIGTYQMLIGVTVPENDFFSAVYNRQLSTLYVAAVILAVGIFLAVLVVRKYSYQIKDLPTQKLNGKNRADQLLGLIKGGESRIVEFKSTMRMNLKTGKAGKEIELAWLKTLVAYLNTDGGLLIIGVNDDGRIVGIEADEFDSDDKCRLHFKNLVNQHIGPELSKLITMSMLSVDGKTIVVIECERSTEPIFLRTKQTEDFYIRSGPSSVKLSVSEVLNYLEGRQ